MKKTLRMLGIAGAAALMSSASLSAATPEGWFLGGAVTFANDSLKVATNKTTGLNFNVGLDRQIGDTNVGFRPGLGITFLPGEWKDDAKISFTGIQLTADLVIQTGIEHFTMITGLSVNNWRYLSDTRNGAESPFGLDGNFAPDAVKLGFRVGFDYKINEHLTADLLLQMTEFGNHPSDEFSFRNINPTWLQAGVKYHF